MKFGRLDILILFIFIIFVYFWIFKNRKKQIENFLYVGGDPFDTTYSKLYNIVFNYDPLYKYDVEIINKTNNKKIDNNKNQIILDAGCGVGRHYYHLSQKNKVIGVDKSENMIKYARIKNPTGIFYVKNLEDDIFVPKKFDKVTCLLDTLYHNTSEKCNKILENFYFWLKDDGLLFIHFYKKDKLDPGPRDFSQYYKGKDGEKHSLTYFDNFTHDAIWKKINNESVKYIEKFIIENGKYQTYENTLFIPDDNKNLIKNILNHGFKLLNIVDYKPIDVDDFELYIFQKIKFDK